MESNDFLTEGVGAARRWRACLRLARIPAAVAFHTLEYAIRAAGRGRNWRSLHPAVFAAELGMIHG